MYFLRIIIRSIIPVVRLLYPTAQPPFRRRYDDTPTRATGARLACDINFARAVLCGLLCAHFVFPGRGAIISRAAGLSGHAAQ